MTRTDYAALLADLDARRLAPEQFRHVDHVGVAFEALRGGDFMQAWHRVAEGIRDMATRAGAPEKFNASITFAYLSTIAERMACGHWTDAEAFIADNPDLCERNHLEGRFTPARLHSALARVVPLLPDLPGPGAPTA